MTESEEKEPKIDAPKPGPSEIESSQSKDSAPSQVATVPPHTVPPQTAPAETMLEQPPVTPAVTVTAPGFWQRIKGLSIAAGRTLYAFFKNSLVQNILVAILSLWLGINWPKAPPPAEIEGLIHAEARLALVSPRTTKVIADYTELFADDASIADATVHRIDGETYGWINKQEIQQRFLTLETFEVLKHERLGEIHVFSDDTRATAVTSTDFRIAGQLPHKSFEQWTFVKVDGRWKISSLTFNLPFNPAR